MAWCIGPGLTLDWQIGDGLTLDWRIGDGLISDWIERRWSGLIGFALVQTQAASGVSGTCIVNWIMDWSKIGRLAEDWLMVGDGRQTGLGNGHWIGIRFRWICVWLNWIMDRSFLVIFSLIGNGLERHLCWVVLDWNGLALMWLGTWFAQEWECIDIGLAFPWWPWIGDEFALDWHKIGPDWCFIETGLTMD